MKRILIFLFMFGGLYFSSFAQKEVFFSTTPQDSIQVENLQGVDLKLLTTKSQILSSLNFSGVGQLIPTVSLSYYNESRIATSWTLNKSIGLQNNLIHYTVYQYDASSGGNFYSTGQKKWDDDLSAFLSLDPHWYWQYKYRRLYGKPYTLNTGWFLSFPLTYAIRLYSSPIESTVGEIYYPKPFTSTFLFIPSLGYRYAISNKFFLEAKVGPAMSFDIGSINPTFDVLLNIRAAYKF